MAADRWPRLNLVQVIKLPCKSVGPVASLLARADDLGAVCN